MQYNEIETYSDIFEEELKDQVSKVGGHVTSEVIFHNMHTYTHTYI